MLHALLMLATEGEETSKTPFYVAGIVLTLWALAVSALGLRGTFPSSAGAARGLMLVSALLVAGAMATAVITG